jgi:hypothetical protein
MDLTNRRRTPTKTRIVLQHLYVLPNTYYERKEQEEIHLSAKQHPSSSPYIELFIVKKMVLVK